MRKFWQKVAISGSLALAIAGGAGAILAPGSVYADNATQQITEGVTAAGGGSNAGKTTDLNDKIKTIINVMLFIVGIASTIMIIYGAIRFVISRGEPDETKNARNTIMYSVVGLVVAILGYAIVNWVIGTIGS
jgi:magnesium-transporting ATPase (P-type)